MEYMSTLYVNLATDGYIADIQLGPHIILDDKVISLEHEYINGEYDWYVAVYFRTKERLIKHTKFLIDLEFISGIKVDSGTIYLMKYNEKYHLDLKRYLIYEVSNTRHITSGEELKLMSGCLYLNDYKVATDVSHIYVGSNFFYYRLQTGMLHYNNKALGYIDTLDRIVTLDNGLLWVLSFHHITLYQYGDMIFRKSITKHDRLVSHHYVTTTGVYVIYKLNPKVSWVTLFCLDGTEEDIMLHDNCSIFVDENYIAKAVGNQVQVRNHDKIFKGSVKATVIKSMKLNTIPYINARISMIDGFYDIDIDFMGD